MAFHSLEEIQKSCREKNVLFWRAVLLEDMADRSVTEAESMQSMQQMWTAMKSASEQYDRTQVSASGLVGKMGAQMEEYRQSKEPLCGPFVSKVIARALEMGESNACMKRIVAAPTAGACGVLPAVLVPLYEEERVSEDEVIHALYTAAGIGQGSHPVHLLPERQVDVRRRLERHLQWQQAHSCFYRVEMKSRSHMERPWR